MYDRFEIWQATQHHGCWGACEIWKQHNGLKYQFRGFGSSRKDVLSDTEMDFMVFFAVLSHYSRMYISHWPSLDFNDVVLLQGHYFNRFWYFIDKESRILSSNFSSPKTNEFNQMFRARSGHYWIPHHICIDCLPNRVFKRRSRKTSKFHVTGLCEGNSPVTGEFPSQKASNAENVFSWWRYHVWAIRTDVTL